MLHDTPNTSGVRFIRAAEEILDRYGEEFYQAVSRSERIVIAVAGEAGVGKTSIACILCRLINEDPHSSPAMFAKHLTADDLYFANYRGAPPGLRGIRRDEAHFAGIGPAEYNWHTEIPPYHSIAKVISTFKGHSPKRICTIPCVDVLTQQIDELTIDFGQEIGKLVAGPDGPIQKTGPVNILIIEGLYAIDPRMAADYNFSISGAYFQDKTWRSLRPQEFDKEEFRERVVQGGEVGRIQQYAKDVMRCMGTQNQEDVRGKESLIEARIVVLELEHQAVQHLRRIVEHEVASGRSIHFATILPMADRIAIESSSR